MIRMFATPALALSALVACEPEYMQTPAETAVVEPAVVTCDASFYQHMIGEPISMAQTINPGVVTRVLPSDGFVTRDFDRNRLTFTTTPDDTIGRVFCG
ncbi:hypothetical protein [Qingshengfaniella alkalisoli]|uniref:Peptidase inhibitor I78 family protein n=1 Tax=Qingshengfaniella alkalisoli TaxID=2599296 RepID=A0A5B8I7Z8_9RHOB|nr:hypothetical protein [Qingshengfaniella alkalisoli]QDY69779.1 hypothetical protein FPZ52_09200 [Qingshengfaniella alkalisoli]